MKSIYESISTLIKIYNKNCIWILLIVILMCVVKAFELKKTKEDDKRWYSYVAVLKHEAFLAVIQMVIIIILMIFVLESFNIDVLKLINLDKYLKIILGVWITLHLRTGVTLYQKLNFSDFVDEVKSGKYNYTTPENIFLDLINGYQINYEMELEKLGIFKAMAPVSLIPLLVGYILDGNSIKIDWNWYTLIIVGSLFLYICALCRSYRNVKVWKVKKLDLENELRRL